MKRSSRKPSKLSAALHRQLNSYALAASAAGVGMLALVQPAEGKVVYTKTDCVVEGRNGTCLLNLDHRGKADFSVLLRSHQTGPRAETLWIVPAPGSNVANLVYTNL